MFVSFLQRFASSTIIKIWARPFTPQGSENVSLEQRDTYRPLTTDKSSHDHHKASCELN